MHVAPSSVLELGRIYARRSPRPDVFSCVIAQGGRDAAAYIALMGHLQPSHGAMYARRVRCASAASPRRTVGRCGSVWTRGGGDCGRLADGRAEGKDLGAGAVAGDLGGHDLVRSSLQRWPEAHRAGTALSRTGNSTGRNSNAHQRSTTARLTEDAVSQPSDVDSISPKSLTFLNFAVGTLTTCPLVNVSFRRSGVVRTGTRWSV